METRPPLLALEYFVATANLGAIRAAATKLNITPSAVSHQIARLEEFLDVQLFRRHKRRLILTDVGNQYLEQLEGALGQIAQATRNASRRDGRRRLRVSLPPTFLNFFVLPRLRSLQELYPDLTLDFEEALTLDPTRNNIDCAVEYRIETNGLLSSERLFDDEVIPLASPEYVEQMGIACLEDVRRCLLIETEKRVFSWNHVLRAFPWRHRCRRTIVPYTYHALAIADLGQGIALANRYNADRLIRTNRLVMPFSIDMINDYAPSYYFSCLPKNQETPAVRLFHSWLVDQVAASQVVDSNPSLPLLATQMQTTLSKE